MCFFGDRIESLVGLRKIVLPRPGRRLLQSVSQPVGSSVRLLDSQIVFGSGLNLLPHQRIGVAQTKLGIIEFRIDLQGRAIVLDRAVKVADIRSISA